MSTEAVTQRIIAHCRKFTHPGVTTSTSLLAQEIIDLCGHCENSTGASTDVTERDADSGTGEPSTGSG